MGFAIARALRALSFDRKLRQCWDGFTANTMMFFSDFLMANLLKTRNLGAWFDVFLSLAPKLFFVPQSFSSS